MNERPTSREEYRGPDRHLDGHLCIDLLQGFLSPAEEKGILAHLKECPACERFLQHKAAEEERNTATRVLRLLPDGEIVLERRGSAIRSRQTVVGWRGGILRRASQHLADAFRLPHYRIAGVAAVAAAVVLVLLWPRGPEISRMFELQVLPSYSFQLESRDIPESAANENLRAGLLAYDRREFKRAAALLQRVDGADLDGVNRTILQIYLGSALVWIGKHKEAVDALDAVSLRSVPGEWGREAQWTMYVALKGAGREASADSLLQVLARKPGAIGERARRFLEP